MKTAYLIRTDGACDYYRAELPLRKMAQNNIDARVEKFKEGDSLNKLGQVFDPADIIMLPRVIEEMFIRLTKEMQKMGKKIVIDHDDNMFNISPFSNHYEDHGTEEVVIEYMGEKMQLWKDGENINIKENRKRMDLCRKALEQADLVTTTTDILANVYREYNDNVTVLPNCLDADLWQKLPLKERTDIRFGWFGGSSHYEDLALIQPALEEVMKKHPQLKLVIMGQFFKGIFKNIPKDRFEFHSWIPTPAYPYKAAILDLDFAVIPLKDTDFNKCKSPIKWVEMGALRVPSVTSYISPYIKDNDINSWIKGISMMAESPEYRKQMGYEAYKTVMDNFNINDKYKLWFDTYRRLTNGYTEPTHDNSTSH
jgi:glycosyltransferase involved in cell wall biosynthesis